MKRYQQPDPYNSLGYWYQMQQQKEQQQQEQQGQQDLQQQGYVKKKGCNCGGKKNKYPRS